MFKLAWSGRSVKILLPRAFQLEVIAPDWIHVKVDAHIFIFAIRPDRKSVVERRVKKGGRRSYQPSERYRQHALEFAVREAQARGLILDQPTSPSGTARSGMEHHKN
jgi:hypothetical protein